MIKIFQNENIRYKDKNDISYNECTFLGSSSVVSANTSNFVPRRSYTQRWGFRVKKIDDVDDMEKRLNGLLRMPSKEIFFPKKDNKEFFIQGFEISTDSKEEGYYSKITLKIEEC